MKVLIKSLLNKSIDKNKQQTMRISSRAFIPLLASAMYYLTQFFAEEATQLFNKNTIIARPSSELFKGEMIESINGQLHLNLKSPDIISSDAINDTISELYGDYIQFLATMLIIHIGILITIKVIEQLRKLPEQLRHLTLQETFESIKDVSKIDRHTFYCSESIKNSLKEIGVYIALLSCSI